MKTILLASMIGLAVVGCQNSSSPRTSSGGMPAASTTPVASPASSVLSPAGQTYVAPTPVAVQQPVIDDAPAASTSVPPSVARTATAAPAKNSQYKVQKGDTLFAIAKRTYGDGKQWKKIQAANPGLTASSLKVGQTITIP